LATRLMPKAALLMVFLIIVGLCYN
jgi:hypothetical protein